MIINFTKHPYFSSSIKACYDKNDRLTNWYVKQFDAEYGRDYHMKYIAQCSGNTGVERETVGIERQVVKIDPATIIQLYNTTIINHKHTRSRALSPSTSLCYPSLLLLSLT